ncbi:hypothetical protein NEUTE2DRAFT_61229 [Neurospora tetrasperma FGSC 2509]|nr:hypothetical protein NEUTE2DRAFT_61229 [Neurospora tetrasperma FGSC 2509]
MMKWLSMTLALVGPSQAALRFGCSTLSIQRLDPLVEPGRLPSSHVHQIVGGNAHSAKNFPTTGRPSCSSSTPTAPTNDFYSNGNQKITAFKPASETVSHGYLKLRVGFRMTVSSPTTNNLNDAKGHVGLRFVCLTDKNTRFPELPDFPTKPCKGGIMTVHHFPSCWDGKNLDSPDHQSHMYNTAKKAFSPAGPCPASHPVRMPQVAYETLWDTTQFNNMWPKDGSNPFVLSYGVNKGYGTHADYVFGWKGDSLQKAMDSSCMFNACENGRPLKSQNVQAMNKCAVKNMVNEDLDSWLKVLPGQAM